MVEGAPRSHRACFRSREKREKLTFVIQAVMHSWAKIKGGIYEEKNYTSPQAKREGLLC